MPKGSKQVATIGSKEVDPIDWTGMDDVGAFLHYSGERADEKETEIA